MKYLSALPSSAHFDKISKIHLDRQKWVNQNKKGFLRYRTPFQNLSRFQATYIDCSGDIVTIGSKDEVNTDEQRRVRDGLKKFMPWRKGPFSIFGIDVDAEWRSERKWHHIIPELPDLKGKIVADIGCNNGYYMFRMSAFEPRLVIGLEPSVQHYYCFKALNSMAGLDQLDIDLLGVEHIHYFESCFDVVFLLGIIYHRPSPIGTLRDIHTSLQPGGTLILESQAIPGSEPIALFPDKTYAKVPGTYFVPTGPCLCNWMKKAGFKNVSFFCSHPMSAQEQRRTAWMQFESYEDFIDKNTPGKTVEGYPAPCRVFLKGEKQ
ncbi:MAG: tRNA 5-methoxyuridine(34)/uridine 5-oxyacetic acid(34) synthase CmoB [Deltaproteobacteria bacterium]|nr:tRNA 5-methoxyuridine(34)/uridine 5-oxyacetic acid(34) synthase CmoB [Deltaproteobacteria bacterium]MBW2658233.1 tRNA 5-methoxyuridine(34)/uridine 5-oxyacetic acid(34) synthase CmoB [Deltaproteobacteria bacterium]